MRQVVVTGMGCVSPLGSGVAEAWANAAAGRSGLAPVVQPLPGEAEGIEAVAGRAPPNALAVLKARFSRRQIAGVDRFAALAAAASLEAIEAAGLLGDAALTEAFVIWGSASMGHEAVEAGYHRLLRQGLGSVHPMTIPRMMNSAAASQISMLFGVRGHCMSVSSACASSAHAVAEGLHAIRAGRTDVVIAGGSDASLNFASLHAWRDIQAMSPTTCRPFSLGRDGTSLGEGAATLVLESAEHAAARGARPLAVIAGAGSTSDAAHITQPDATSAARAIRLALSDAGLTSDEPVLISAHGTGTALNDRSETEALRSVFGNALPTCQVIATKSAHGHMLGATGAMELLLGIEALRAGLAPPVLGYLGPDPECDLPLALTAVPITYGTLVSNSFAFGGLNCVLVARHADA